jgi:hypothetical protein
MSETDIRSALRSAPVLDEAGSEERSWEVVRAAYVSREPVGWSRRHRGPVLAFAVSALVAAGILVAVLTPPGQAVVDRLRDAVGRTPSEPALVRLPTSGRLLVLSSSGPWVVHADGSKRLLGGYGDASWSSHGLYVAAAQEQHLVAVDAESGDVRWSLARNLPVSDPSWSGGGLDTRIAYRAGSELHVVAGDGSPDELLASGVAPVAAAWRGDSHVLAYADRQGRVHVFDADAGKELGRTPPGPAVRQLAFDRDGRLVVATAKEILVYRRTLRGKPLVFARAEADHEILGFAPNGYGLVYADYDRAKDATTLVRPLCSTAGACLLLLSPDTSLFRGAGRVEGLATSPDGRWVVSGWPAADQLIFLRLAPRIGKVVAVSNATDEFSPGRPAGASFPVVAGWAQDAP